MLMMYDYRKTLIELEKFPKEKPELKTLEWDILNSDRLINLEINNKRRTSII